MASSGTVTKRGAPRGRSRGRIRGRRQRGRAASLEDSLSAIDPVIHERVRLGIVSALAVNDTLAFSELKQILNTSDGNLSVHARKLEDAGYVVCSKCFVGRVPRTFFRLSAGGRRSLDHYLAQMENLIEATREGVP